MTIARRTKYTYADFLKFPDDGNRHEIIAGEWIMTPPPNVNHQRVVGNIQMILGRHVRERELGEILAAPIGVVLSKTDAVQPDVLFVSRKRSGLLKKDALHGAPDLAIEVLSPSTSIVDRNRKLNLYEKSKVLEYWIVDPVNRSIEVHEFGAARRLRILQEGQSFASSILPGLTLQVAEFFSRLR